MSIGLPRRYLALAVLVIGVLFFFPFYAGDFRMNQLGLFLCFVIFALSLDLIWGFNGITDYGSYSSNVNFYWVILAVTVFFFWLARRITTSHFGMILQSIRENELRSEFFGFEVANYKIFVFTVAAMMSAVAGGLYAALNCIISHLEIGPLLSVEGVIWVAVGGRGTLIGAFVGPILIKGAESLLSEQFAWMWGLLVGLIFILVIVLMPDGIVGTLLRRARRRRALAAGRALVYDPRATGAEDTPTA